MDSACAAARKCLHRTSSGVRGRKATQFLHWRQHTQSVHWSRAFRKSQAWLDRPSVKQVEYQVQLQQRSTWRGACPAYLPVKLVLENPVGVLPFFLLPPNGWTAVLDDDALPAIYQASWICLENGYHNMHQ